MEENTGKKEITGDSWSDVEDPVEEMLHPVTIKPLTVLKLLLLVVGLLLLANVVAIFLSQTMEDSIITRYVDVYFNFNLENNIPSFFSSIILFVASCLLFLIYRSKPLPASGSGKKQWLILSLIFLFLAVDENVGIHEDVTLVVKSLLDNDLPDFLHWAWVIPYFVAFLVIAAFFLPFVLSLPPFTRNLFFIAGFVFVSGAVGLELVEGYVYINYGLNHIYNVILYCLEELMEMTGVVLFIYALLDYLARQKSQLLIRR